MPEPLDNTVLVESEERDTPERPTEEQEAVGRMQEETEEVEPRQSEESDNENLPVLEIEEKPLSEDEKRRLGFLQQQMISIFVLTHPREANMSDEEYKTSVEEGVEALKKEAEEGRFGPATREAYKNTVDWLEKSAIPGAITEMSRLSLPLPPGTPLSLPEDAQGRVVGTDYYKQLVISGKTKPDLGLDSTRVPSELDLEKMDDTLLWLKEVDQSARNARLRLQDELLEREIKNLIRDPERQAAWLDKRGSDPAEWRAAAIEAVDLATRVRNYVEAMDSLERSSRGYNFEPPPGAVIQRDDDGKITHINLDLPKDLRLDHPENKKRMEDLRNWMKEHGDEIDQAVRELMQLEQNPDRLLFWGEVDTPGGLVRLDDNGDIKEFVEEKDADGTEIEFNFADLEFDVEERMVNGQKKIVVSNSVQYRYANWYNYLNIGAGEVGNRTDVEPREYDPEDWVAIRNGGKVELVKAKDLASWKTRQQVFHYGEKALIATLDVGMTVGAVVTLGGTAAATAAGRLVVGQAVKQASKAALRASVGLAGIVNNSYWRGTEVGQAIQVARGIYFVGDAALGLTTSGYRAVQGLRGVEGTTNTAAAIVEAQIKASRWATTYKTAETAVRLTELPFAYIIYHDIKHQVEELGEIGRADPTRQIIRQAAEGQGDQAPEANRPAEIDPNKAQIAELDRYNELLKGNQANPRVQEIVDQTRALIEKDASAEERAEYIAQLMTEFQPDGETIKDLELEGDFSRYKAGGHVEYAEGRDRAVQTAAALAILQLSRKADGSLPETLGQRTVVVPEYEYTEYVDGGPEVGSYPVTRTKEQRNEVQEITTEDLAKFLRREVEYPQDESRLVASTDLALQLGVASGTEVAGVLQDVISNESSTNTEKVQAILRLGAIVDAVKIQEAVAGTPQEQFKAQSRRVGLSSQAIESFLENVATSSNNEDIRAAAALMVQASSEATPEARQQLVNTYSLKMSELGGTNGAFSKYAVDTLSTLMEDNTRSGEQRLAAARSMLHLVEAGGTAIDEKPGIERKTYEAVAGVIDPTNVVVSQQAIETLVPDGLALLNTENPRLASTVRMKGIQIVSDTVNQIADNTLTVEGNKQRSEFFSVIKPLIKDGSQLQKSQMDLQLRRLIDEREIATFAEVSPELRIASIRALADLGARGSMDVIRHRLAGSSADGIKPDWNAAVRYEALRALETMKDPELRQTVLSIIHTEKDPSVSALLRDVRFSQERLDPTSEEYKEAYETAATAILQDPWEGYDALKRQVGNQNLTTFIRNWRDSNYDLLDGVEFNRYRDRKGDAAADAVYAGFLGSIDWFFSKGSTVRREENKARNAERTRITNLRNTQFDNLIEKAQQTSVDGMKAKMVLVDILTNGGQPFASSESQWAQEQAAEALANMAKPGNENRDYVFWAIRDGLTSGRAMSPTARHSLLTGLETLAKPDSSGRAAISREQAAMTVAKALELQNSQRAPYRADVSLQKRLVINLWNLGHHRSYPVLEAMIDHTRDPDLKKEVEATLAKLRDRLNPMWIDTVPDTTSSLADRARRMEQTLGENSDSQTTVQTIFSAMKQSPITAADDPRIPILRIALNDSNERVRLAAAISLAGLADPAVVDLAPARAVLNDIHRNGSSKGARDDAWYQIYLLTRQTHKDWQYWHDRMFK